MFLLSFVYIICFTIHLTIPNITLSSIWLTLCPMIHTIKRKPYSPLDKLFLFPTLNYFVTHTCYLKILVALDFHTSYKCTALPLEKIAVTLLSCIIPAHRQWCIVCEIRSDLVFACIFQSKNILYSSGLSFLSFLHISTHSFKFLFHFWIHRRNYSKIDIRPMISSMYTSCAT